MKMSRWIIPLILLCLVPPTTLRAQDDIPDNCEYQYGAAYRPALFPRYEPQNRRLVLVDWTSGADVLTLATDVNDTLIRAWSASCRYLAVATGSSDSRDTVVYDTITGERVGSVPDARGVPHPLTWGVNDFLVVEGRHGAVLWNVPAAIQYPLDVGYSVHTNRNFSRLRWDAAAAQLTANLAVGGRIVYDLNTGTPTVLAASQPGTLILGGERFDCQPGRRGGAYLQHGRLDMRYALDGGVIYLGRGRNESLLTLEGDISTAYVRPMGWSVNCRYIAAAIQTDSIIPTYETAIWDVLAQRRVATFPDARGVPHRLWWDTHETHVLIQTRNGAYVWDIEADTRVLVNPAVSEPPATCYESGCAGISFTSVYWDAGRRQMLGVPIQTPNTVVAYDVTTGAEVARYPFDGVTTVNFITSNDSRWLVVNGVGNAMIWDRETGAAVSFPSGYIESPHTHFSDEASISTDNRYLAIMDTTLRVWDITTLSAGSAPTFIYTRQQLPRAFHASFQFRNGDTLVNYDGRVGINVVTGVIFGDQGDSFDPAAQSPQTFAPITGVSGWGRSASWFGSEPQCNVAVRYDAAARQLIARTFAPASEIILEADLNLARPLYLSPDCRTAYATVRLNNTSLPYDETPGIASYDYHRTTRYVFWDIDTGARVATLENPPLGKHDYARVVWNPVGDRAFVRVGSGYFLIHPASGSVLPMRFQDTDRGQLPPRGVMYWDHARGLLILAGWGEAFAIDMETGIERLRFPVRDSERGGCARAQLGCDIDISADGQWVYVYGHASRSAWNLDTLDHTVTIYPPSS